MGPPSRTQHFLRYSQERHFGDAGREVGLVSRPRADPQNFFKAWRSDILFLEMREVRLTEEREMAQLGNCSGSRRRGRVAAAWSLAPNCIRWVCCI